MKIKGFTHAGELDDRVEDVDELLGGAAGLLDRACAADILGQVVFLTEEGEWKVACVEVVIGDANPRYLRDVLEEFVDDEDSADHPLLADAKRWLADNAR